jgi:hypothetical protein
MPMMKKIVPQETIDKVKKMYADGVRIKQIMQDVGLSMAVMYRIIGHDRRREYTNRMNTRGDVSISLKQIQNSLIKTAKAIRELKTLEVGQMVRLIYKVKGIGRKTDDYSNQEPDFMAPDMGIVKQICVKGVCIQGTDKPRMVYVSVADMVQKKVLVEVIH